MRNYLLIGFLFLSIAAKSQQFTFVSDRVFESSADLLGYTFIPAYIVYPNKYDLNSSAKNELEVGEFSFNITPNRLYIKGENVEGVYSINSINPTEYGYIITTMDATDPKIQGHLKITLNNDNQVTGLIFKMSKNAKETVYKLAEIHESLKQTEVNYFTNMDNLPITTDVIWNREFRPFFRIGEEQQRLRIEDSVKIEVTRDSLIIKKKKKEKVDIQYLITISYKGFDDKGNRKDYQQQYAVKRLKERMSRDPKATKDKFLIEVEVKGLPEKYVYFYLNEKRAVSMIELGPNMFLIRGY